MVVTSACYRRHRASLQIKRGGAAMVTPAGAGALTEVRKILSPRSFIVKKFNFERKSGCKSQNA